MSSQSQNKQSHILLIEDDAVSAQVVSDNFEHLNCRVDHVTTGEMALEKFKANTYDLVLMDIGLPSIDGLDVTKKIRLYEINISHKPPVPIIGISGTHEPFIKIKCLEAGMTNLISKPLTTETANNILQTFVHEAHLRNDAFSTENLATTSGRILNTSTIYDLVEKSKNSEKMREIIDKAINRFPGIIKDLELAHFKGNWKKIREIVLHLSGESAYYGMERLKVSCAQIMENIDSNQHDYIESMYKELLQQINLAYEEYIRIKIKGII